MLAGLIAATAEVEGEGGLVAELPIAGQSLLEQQARLLSAAGANRILLLVERTPAPLMAAIDRLRRDGVTVDLARGVDDLADRVHPDEQLLLIQPGLVTDRKAVERLLEAHAPALLVLPDTPENAAWERIDADSRWAGLVLVDGALLRQTAGMLGDWDLVSTLLRRAVQDGAAQVDLAGLSPLLAPVVDRRGAATVDALLARRQREDFTSLPDRYVFAPIAALAAPRAMRAAVAPDWLRSGAIGLILLGALAFGLGWRWPGLLLLLVAGAVDGVGRRLAALGHRAPEQMRHFERLKLVALAAAALALGWRLSIEGGGWGCIALVLAAFGFALALANHRRLIGEGRERPLWLADADSLVWLYALFALVGAWVAGLGALSAYLLLSLLVQQRASARKSSPTGLARF